MSTLRAALEIRWTSAHRDARDLLDRRGGVGALPGMYRDLLGFVAERPRTPRRHHRQAGSAGYRDQLSPGRRRLTASVGRLSGLCREPAHLRPAAIEWPCGGDCLLELTLMIRRAVTPR